MFNPSVLTDPADHGRVMQGTFNKRPDGTVEIGFVYQDGYSPPTTVEQQNPPVDGEMIHQEWSIQPDGSTKYFQQFEGGATKTYVVDDNTEDDPSDPVGGNTVEEGNQGADPGGEPGEEGGEQQGGEHEGGGEEGGEHEGGGGE